MKYMVIGLLIHLIKGNILEEGKCPELEPFKNFDANKIVGVWYIVQHYPNDYDSHYKCIKENCTLTDNGDLLMHYTALKKINNDIIDGNSTFANVGDPTVGNFLLTSTRTTPKEVKVPIIILDTDYEYYLTLWVCLEKDDLSARLAWILSRSTTLNSEVLNKAIAPLKENNLNPEYMEVVDHETCNY